jgi:hypothetical protein
MSIAHITFPPGRFVWGSHVNAKTKDRDGNPILIKKGADAGKPTQRFEFGVAIPKDVVDLTTGQKSRPNWKDTEWGREIVRVAKEVYPAGQFDSPSFSWKVTDGDSTVPNDNGSVPCTREGYPGHWVLAFSSSFAPKTVNSDGSEFIDPTVIKLGHYIQVAGSCKVEFRTSKPGVFLNHRVIAHAGFGKEIVTGPDPKSIGFGKAPLPPGASATPVAALRVETPVAAPAPVAAPPPAVPPVAAPVAVKPHTGFLTPPAPPVAAAPAAPVMTEKANGASYAQMIAGGWTHAQMVEHGYVK